MVVSISGNNLTVYHTEVFPKGEGKGLGKELLEAMVDHARKKGLKVIALCPFVHAQFKRHPDTYADAEDLMQDTHVAAYTELAKFQGRASYKTWISRIMINKCLYKLKYGYFRNEVPNGQIPELNIRPMYMKDNENQTDQILMNRELGIVLERSIQNIPVIYRTVFVLREIEGFSVAETAELLDITRVNVKVRLNRAKTLLQKELEQSYTHTDLYSFNLIYCDAIVERVFEKIKSISQV